MKRWSRRAILQAGTAAAGTAFMPVRSVFGQAAANPLLRAPKQALVIGNSRYRHEPLKNPENDAKGMADVLQKAGFAVSLHLDLPRAGAQQAIAMFTASLAKTKAVGLFYYAGHGAQLAWRNYLIPVDAQIENAEQLRERCVDLNTIIEGIAKAGNPMNVLILDACRDNPFGSVRTEQKGLSQIDAPPGTLLAYATAPGNTASDGDGANGLYTEHLLKEILVPDAKIEDVFKRVRLGVRRKSSGRQIPWESTSLEEDFWFMPPLPLQQLLAQEREREYKEQQAAWDRIKAAETPKPIEDFLRRYPGGPFTEPATARLEFLVQREREQAEIKRKQIEAERERLYREQQAGWDKIKNGDSPQAVEDFLRRYPGGPFAEQASARLEFLAQREREQAELKRKQLEAERDRQRRELQTAWENVKEATAAAPLEDFLRRYPSSAYTDQARARIDGLLAQQREALERSRREAEELRAKEQQEQLAAWNQVKDANAPEPLEEFLQRHPGSTYAEQARARLQQVVARQRDERELARKQVEAERDRLRREQLIAWEKLKNTESVESIEEFVRLYPGGPYTEQAQARLGQLVSRRRREEEERQRVYREQLPAWEKVRDASTPEPLQEFIQRYPAGPFTEQARTRLNFILARQKEVRELSQKELEAQRERDYREQAAQWDKLKETPSVDALEDFLRRYPSGQFAELAQARLDLLLARQGEQRLQVVTSKANPYSKGSAILSTAYKVGDSYTYNHIDVFTGLARTYTTTIEEITESEVIYDGGRFITDRLGNRLRSHDGRTFTPSQNIALEYAVGRKWTSRFNATNVNGQLGQVVLDWHIVGREMVRVPGGEFDAFRVEGRGWNTGQGAGATLEIRSTYWMAPDRLRRPIILIDFRRRGTVVIANSRDELVEFKEQ